MAALATYIICDSPGRLPRSRVLRASAKERNNPGVRHGQSAVLQRMSKTPTRKESHLLRTLALLVSQHRNMSVRNAVKAHIIAKKACPTEDVASVTLCSALCSDYQTNIVSRVRVSRYYLPFSEGVHVIQTLHKSCFTKNLSEKSRCTPTQKNVSFLRTCIGRTTALWPDITPAF